MTDPSSKDRPPETGGDLLLRHPRVVSDPEVCRAYAADSSGLAHTPDAIARPESEAEVQDLVRLAAAHGVPLTPQGLRSSTTGASVATQGIALSLERMGRVLEIDPERRTAVAEPGIVLGEFKRRLREAGLFYPPDPTSENECTLGGTVATDASGSRTYRYGPTRPYVRALRVVLADGSVTEVRRSGANKNAAGYFGFQNPIDLWIGSEGTLGIVTRVEVSCLPPPPGFFGGMAFFPNWHAAVGFVLAADRARQEGQLAPRCLELFDGPALELVSPGASGFRIPPGADSAIFFEQETVPEEELAALERWFPVIEDAGGMADLTLVARSEAEKEELRRLRHAIPAGTNERAAQLALRGGRKVSTDFAVALERLPEMMEDAHAIARDVFGGYVTAYGHVGNGHPHFNLLAEDPPALARAEEAALQMARRAIELGGTISAEHGIGKTKRRIFRELYPEWLVRGMEAVKHAMDPKGILAPGNLFE